MSEGVIDPKNPEKACPHQRLILLWSVRSGTVKGGTIGSSRHTPTVE